MQDVFSHIAPCYPLMLQQIRGFQTYYPISSHAQGYLTSGSGAGFGKDSLCSAYGEFIERNHFYLNVKTDKKARLQDANDLQVANSVCSMIDQVKITDECPRQHLFHLSKVNNIFTQKECYFPSALISLAFLDKEDRDHLPFVDSCGEAGHITHDKAFHSALFEFIERQALIGSWLTRMYRYKIPADVILANKKQRKMAEQLLKQGEIHVFDVALNLPGFAVLILYFSKSKKDYVQYSIGMSAGSSPEEAIYKALNELWLDYGYLYISDAVKNRLTAVASSRSYTVRHIEDNDVIKTKKIMAYNLLAESNITVSDYLALPSITDQTACTELKKISSNIFEYHHSDSRSGHEYVKIVSPDFLLHMSVKNKLNTDNAYMRTLQADMQNLYRETIPFP